MGDLKRFPAPIRIRWRVLVELPDGNVIYGTSDDDLVERWGRLLGWLSGSPLPADSTRATVARYVRAVYDPSLPHGCEDMTNVDFLEAIDRSGAVTLIRK